MQFTTVPRFDLSERNGLMHDLDRQRAGAVGLPGWWRREQDLNVVVCMMSMCRSRCEAAQRERIVLTIIRAEPSIVECRIELSDEKHHELVAANAGIKCVLSCVCFW